MTAARKPRVVDATEPLEAVVRQRHRVAFVSCSPSRCVAANALLDLAGVIDARTSYKTTLVMWEPDVWTRYATEENTEAVMRRVDECGDPIPVRFRLRFLPHPEPLGSRAGERSGTDKRSGANTSVATRTPSPRRLWHEPDQEDR